MTENKSAMAKDDMSIAEKASAYQSNRVGVLPYSTIHAKEADVSSNFTINFMKAEKNVILL